MKHTHAENMMAYAQDAMETDKPWERWEYMPKEFPDKWYQCEGHPSWIIPNQYRRKPRTININGHEVPEPVREPLMHGQEYFSVDTWNDKIVENYCWVNDRVDQIMLQRGLIHLTREAAELHAKALLSFTATKARMQSRLQCSYGVNRIARDALKFLACHRLVRMSPCCCGVALKLQRIVNDACL